jgi:hypothetical protein
MGRLACFMSGGKPYLVWTTDVGRMLAVVSGTGYPGGVYNWWASLHHVIIFPGTEMCGMARHGRADGLGAAWQPDPGTGLPGRRGNCGLTINERRIADR